MEYFEIPKWKDFQHYKDRDPPWIKLHFSLLTSSTWVMLDDASRVLAVACMLIASRNHGKVPCDSDYMKRVAYLKSANFKPLIDCGFLVPLASASTLQAKATTEERREETEESKNTSSPKATDDRFEQFWKAYPKKKAKGDAEKAWSKAKINGEFPQILQALAAQKNSQDWIKEQGQYIPYPATWINRQSWLDEVSGTTDRSSLFAGGI